MTIKEARVQEGLAALKAVLEEYDFEIAFECDDSSDLYGLSGESLIIEQAGLVVFDSGCWGIDKNSFM